MNKVIVLGTYQGGMREHGKATFFSVLHTRYSKNRDGGFEKTTQWIPFTCFGYVADKVKKMTKGDSVVVEGTVSMYKGENDTYEKMSIRADKIHSIWNKDNFGEQKSDDQYGKQTPDFGEDPDIPF